MPWRDENSWLGGYMSYEDKYNDYKEEIDMKYANYRCSVAKTITLFEEEVQLSEDCVNESMSNNIQHEESRDQDDGVQDSENYGCFNPGSEQINSTDDLASDIRISQNQTAYDIEFIDRELDDHSYRSLFQSLNVKQRIFFDNVLHWFKTRSTPLYTFLTGGAGVGKSVELKALYQALLKYFSHAV